MSIEYEWYARRRSPMPDTEPALRVGKWDIGFVGYDWTSAAPRGCRYVAYTSLPGIKAEQGHYSTVKEAKAAVEQCAKYWFYHLILRGNEESVPAKRISRTRRTVEPARVRRTRTLESVGRVRRAPRAQ